MKELPSIRGLSHTAEKHSSSNPNAAQNTTLPHELAFRGSLWDQLSEDSSERGVGLRACTQLDPSADQLRTYLHPTGRFGRRTTVHHVANNIGSEEGA